MKRNKGMIRLIAFLLILFICFSIIHNITKRKKPYVKMTDFFSQKENFDILFLGSSHPVYGIFPMDLWKNYGIISYNLGGGNETIPGNYYKMLLALEHTKPKMIVLDAFLIDKDTKLMPKKEIFYHNSLDAFPLSYTKYVTIKELFGEHDILDNMFEYLFNFSIYHSRWDELEKNDFKIEQKFVKGTELGMKVYTTKKQMSNFDSIEMYNGKETVGMQYLRKIIEYCQEKEIQVLVTYIPFPAQDNRIADSKYIQVICDEYNVNYINFLNKDIVNYDTDLYDSDHLNVQGARKVTDYIGKYIMDNYDIQDQRKNENYSSWYEDYNEYIDYKIENLKSNSNNLNNYLMLLYGEEDIGYEIKISSKREIREGSTLYNLLKNLENNYEINDSVFKNKTINITTWDKRDGSLINALWW